jgi:ADP-ribose pyrophosphatase YjhB (NUDIX family)
MTLRRRFEPFITAGFRAYWRLTRGMTLGVRGLVLDEARRVLLVQHTYTPGWHMPGGGVEHLESAEEALARELVEEAGVELVGRPTLLQVQANHRSFPNDHVLVYLVERWRSRPATSRGEISATAWFAPDDLPAEATPSTRRWIVEALSRPPVDGA